MLLFSELLSMLVERMPGGNSLSAAATVTGSGGGLRCAPIGPPPPPTGDDERISGEGESASAAPPPGCNDPGPFIRCRLAEPGPPKRALSSP